jgi:hypothetical protein
MKLKTGQSVRHFRYGWGAVVESDRVQTMVYFHTVGIKKFATSMAPFAVVQDQDPGRKRALWPPLTGGQSISAVKIPISNPSEASSYSESMKTR